MLRLPIPATQQMTVRNGSVQRGFDSTPIIPDEPGHSLLSADSSARPKLGFSSLVVAFTQSIGRLPNFKYRLLA
ncbi:unnamed protein product [Soboliphyme baturini]|uniref:Uncharacterized protein n=1 Tax=Soboliphyme baturini TaxID=241478 RepID=A0A183IPV0_9BILA|nr:unnamed protein product [Soboliphyme baturini]